MSAAQLTRQPPPETPMDEARDLVPVVGAVFQAGPPTYALVALGAIITLLACSPLVTSAAPSTDLVRRDRDRRGRVRRQARSS